MTCALSCLRYLVKCFALERVKEVVLFDNGAILNFLIDSFDSDLVAFLRSSVIACLLGFATTVRDAGK
jgi:hypothetical protein